MKTIMISHHRPDELQFKLHMSPRVRLCCVHLIFEMLIDVNHHGRAASYANRWILQLIRGIDCNNGKREFDPSSRTLMSNYYHAASLIMGRYRRRRACSRGARVICIATAIKFNLHINSNYSIETLVAQS